jgi:hypothetical protein
MRALPEGRTVVTNLRLPGQHDERLLGSIGLKGPYYNWNRWYLPSVITVSVTRDPNADSHTEFGVGWTIGFEIAGHQ